MIRNIHLKKTFLGGFFLIFIIRHKLMSNTHTLSVSHTRTNRYSLSLSLSTESIYILHRDTPHTNKTYNSSLSLGSRHTLNLSPHTCKTSFLSLDHTHSLSLSLTHTHTQTHYVHIMYISIYHVWISIILDAFSRMSMIRILVYEYGTNGTYG